MNPLIIIPARLASTRLPRKPLADIHGQPMIVRVWERAMAAQLAPVVVACDHEDTKSAITAQGGQAILTEPDLPSGSDRIWAALKNLDKIAQFDTIINLQGDLPTLEPQLIESVLEPIQRGFDIGTLSTRISDPTEINSPHVVKIAMTGKDEDTVRQALYFSRAPIPYGQGTYHHHIGIYAYTRQALETYVHTPPSVLEMREKLEQLRALEIGLRIGVRYVKTVPLGVDTLEDLERARIAFHKA